MREALGIEPDARAKNKQGAFDRHFANLAACARPQKDGGLRVLSRVRPLTIRSGTNWSHVYRDSLPP